MAEEEKEEHSSRHYLTVVELAYLSGTSRAVVQRLVSLELIRPVRSEPEPCFRPDQTDTVRKLLRLHTQLGIGWSSMEVVMDLLDRIDELEARLGRDR